MRRLTLLAALFAALFAVAGLAPAAEAAPRPLVVILADPTGTEAPDLLAPYAVLAESGAVDVKVVSPTAAPVRLTKGVAWVAPQMTLGELRRRPDVVIVPAMAKVEDPRRTAWLKAQLAAGARIMSICNGAKVLAAAGLLDGRQATTHWFTRGRLKLTRRDVAWREDVRWVTDGPVTTTAGISAGEPASLQLLRELAGEDVMRATAARLGLAAPEQKHPGRDYRLTWTGAATVTGNVVAFWRRDDVAVPLSPGVDELAFGTALDGWSRTYRSKAWAAGPPSVVSRHGLTLIRARATPGFERRVALPQAPEATFAAIGRAYGERTARFVALQFEHPWGAVTRW